MVEVGEKEDVRRCCREAGAELWSLRSSSINSDSNESTSANPKNLVNVIFSIRSCVKAFSAGANKRILP